MNTCKTCTHWKVAESDEWTDQQMTQPVDPDTDEPMVFEFEVRVCKHPSKTFMERPVEKNGFGIADGSHYKAVFVTSEDYGCVRHDC